RTAAAAAAVAARLGFVHANRASLDISSVQLLDRRIRRFIGRHLDKSEAARPVRGAIDYDLRALDLTRFRENVLQILIRHRPSQIPYVQSSAHYLLPARRKSCRPVQTARPIKYSLPKCFWGQSSEKRRVAVRIR